MSGSPRLSARRGRSASHLRRLLWPTGVAFRNRGRRGRIEEPDDLLDRLGSPFAKSSPFDRLVAASRHERLVVAIHASFMEDLRPDEAFVIDQIRQAPDEWGVRTFAVGTEARDWNHIPVMQFERRGGGMFGEVGKIEWDALTESETGLALFDGAQAFLKTQVPGRALHAVHDVLAAAEAGAHVVVSRDRDVLRARDKRVLRDANVLTPLEAGVAIGVWSRATGRNGTFAHWVSGDFMYYWALARALTPAGWPAFAAFVHGSRVFPEGERLQALAQSILTRLDYLVEAVDDMYVLWQREVTNPVVEDISNLLDSILLRGWAIQDNAAVLLSTWFGVEQDDPARVSLHDARWRKAIRDSGPEAGKVLVLLEPARLRLAASQTLRHHAVHRETLSAMTVQAEGGQKGVSLFLPAPSSGELRSALQSAGEAPADWGLGDEIAPHAVHNSVDHGDGYVEEFEEDAAGGTFLDPMLFAARFVAAVAELANGLFAALRPADDPRLLAPLRERALRSPRERWASAEFGWQLVLASPLSGLVRWAEPPQADGTNDQRKPG